MQRKWILRCCLCLSALVVFFAGLPSAHAAYLIQDQELQQWQMELNLQKQLITRQRNNEKKLKLELQELRGQLTESKLALKNQQILLTNTQQALNDANISLTRYAQEEKLKRLKIKKQRNLYCCVAIGVAVGWIFNNTGILKI